MQNKKSMFDNVNIAWDFAPEDQSTDFSDEDLVDDKVSVAIIRLFWTVEINSFLALIKPQLTNSNNTALGLH